MSLIFGWESSSEKRSECSDKSPSLGVERLGWEFLPPLPNQALNSHGFAVSTAGQRVGVYDVVGDPTFDLGATRRRYKRVFAGDNRYAWHPGLEAAVDHTVPGTWPDMCLRLPKRLTSAQVGELLNLTDAEVAIHMRLRLLKPLANPSQNSHKWFSSEYILSLDEKWLSRATTAIYANTRGRNSKSVEASEMAA